MNAVYLTHIDGARNMARYYTMSLQETLFAEWSLVREWGRLGRGGQVKTTNFTTMDGANQAFQAIQKSKIKRGYRVI